MSANREIDIEGHRIVASAFNEEKDGIPVIFIHGITTSINFWEAIQTPIFKENFRWYSLSLPGHYPARLPIEFRKESLTEDMLAQVLMTAIREIVNEEKIILVGHSTGGFAALNIAARNPEIIAGVISISGFAQGKWKGALGMLQKLARFGPIGRVLFKTNLKILGSYRFIYRIGVGLYANDRRAMNSFPGFESTLDLVYPDAQQLDRNAMIPFFNRLPDIDISQLLPNVTSPTLVLAGDRDPIVPPEQSRLISERVPNAELVLLEGSGHLPMFERPVEYNRAITEWVQKIMQSL